MTERQRLEQQIREVLATEAHAIPLSAKLFGPDGLFHQLATMEEERRAVAQSPLFREAQRRLSELQQDEAAGFARAVQQIRGTIPEGSYLLKLEER